MNNIEYYIERLDNFDIGLGIIKIFALPINEDDNISIIKNVLSTLAEFCFSMNANLELRFQNENNDISIYLLLRICDKNMDYLIQHKIKEIYNFIIENGIEANIIPISEFLNTLNKQAENQSTILFKQPEIDIPNINLTEYYYSISPTTFENPYDFFKLIISLIYENINTSLSISVTPTALNDLNTTINTIYHTLSNISNGFEDQYYGRIIDYGAQKHTNNYLRFLQNNLFYEVVIYISEKTNNITNQIINYLCRYNNWDYFQEKIIEYYDFINYPFIISHTLKENLKKTQFWQQQNAPFTLFDLQLTVSLDELITIFTIPNLKDYSVKGIKISRNDQIMGLINEKLINKSILIGNTTNQNQISLSLNDFSKHLFVTGVPGAGKTVFLENILFQLYKEKINFLVIEPAKKEYRSLKQIIPELVVFTPGNNNCVPFVINPFVPPKNVPLQIYKSSLINALEVAFDMESTLKRLFRETIDICYIKNGWRDDSLSSDSYLTHFGLYEFLQEFELAMKDKYDHETRERIQTAGIMRIKNMLNMDSVLFDNVHSITIDELISMPVVIELNAIEENEQKSLIMALLLTSLFAYSNVCIKKNDAQLNHLLLIEEAHVLLKENKIDGPSLGQNLVSRILLEKRSSGFALAIADQSPKNVSDDVTKQTGTKVCFRMVSSEDREIIGKTMGMKIDEINNLINLKPGEMYFFNEYLDKSLLLKTENFRKKHNINDTVSDDLIQHLSSYWEKHKEKSRPYNECQYIPTCSNQNCQISLRLEAKFLANSYFYNYYNGKPMTMNLFLDGLKHIDSFLKTHNRYKFKNHDFLILSNCTKCQLLRKINMESTLKISLSQRIKLMKNRTFIKER